MYVAIAGVKDDDENDDSDLESNPSSILKIRMLFKKINKAKQNQN